MTKLIVEGYMVKYPGHRGAIMLASSDGLSINRRAAIAKFMKRIHGKFSWKHIYRRGGRVVWVKIREISEA